MFHEAHATYLELRGSYAKATAAFEAGIQRSDAPVVCSCLWLYAARALPRAEEAHTHSELLHGCTCLVLESKASSELRERTMK